MLSRKRSGGQSGKYLSSKNKVNDGEREKERGFSKKKLEEGARNCLTEK